MFICKLRNTQIMITIFGKTEYIIPILSEKNRVENC